MYSATAIDLYADLLKSADETVKTANWLTAGMGRLMGSSAIRDAGAHMLEGAASGVAHATPIEMNAGRRALMRGGAEANALHRAEVLKKLDARQAQNMASHIRGAIDPAAAQQAVSRFHGATPEMQAAVQQHLMPAPKPAAATPTKSLMPNPKTMLGMGAAGLGAGYGGYALGQHNQATADKTQRNLAFGAGAATGLALPGMLNGAASMAQNFSMRPGNMFGGGYGY